MARPRLGESESKRLQMVITEDEIQAVDDWRWANRVASRSEAIRRLVQIGLVFDREADGVAEALVDTQSATHSTWHKLKEIKDVDAAAYRDGVARIVRNELRDMANNIAEANNRFMALLGEIVPFKWASTMHAAMTEASEERKAMQDEINKAREQNIIKTRAVREGKPDS